MNSFGVSCAQVFELAVQSIARGVQHRGVFRLAHNSGLFDVILVFFSSLVSFGASQIPLYAEFAPKFVRPHRNASTPAATPTPTRSQQLQSSTTEWDELEAAEVNLGWNQARSEDSEFLKFLKTCVAVNLDLVRDVFCSLARLVECGNICWFYRL